jgi:site-specific DNA recombinase
VRCAIYTRKSTEEGLSQEFNSLKAQRECAEAYIASQRQQGWILLPQRYDDGGCSGATLDRPALQQLLTEVAAGSIDCVVIYKVDRLSRSLFDFARLMQVFDQQGVSLVAVTQQFNSSTPMGRLTLHILLSFAQFEREIISERTRDKIGASRRKGKWMGGYPVLGYDPDPSRPRLVVNQIEAQQVREIFARFVRSGSLIATLDEIDERGWGMKSWTTRKGQHHAGRRFDRSALVRLLKTVLYLGEVQHHGRIYTGEQAAIVERRIWAKAQALLQSQKRGSAGGARNRQAALLKGLLVCAGCGQPMVAGYTTTRGRRYEYYVCQVAQKRGVRICPGKLVSRRRIEAAVVEALYRVAGEPGRECLQQALGVDQAGWEKLNQTEQHGILERVVEQIRFDRRLGQGRLRWRAEVGDKPGEEVGIRVGKKALVQQVPPAPVEKPSMRSLDGRLPRITKLLALAVRLEELLRAGTAKDYADLCKTPKE